MKLLIKAGATSNILQVFVRDSSSTIGAGLTGLTSGSSGLTAYYHKQSDTTATAISLTSMTVGTFTSSGFGEIDSTNMPGWYQLCPPDTAFTSATGLALHLKGATNMAALPIEVELTAFDPQDSVRLGLTALPNAAAQASGGLYTRGSGAGQINQNANGQVDVNAVTMSGTSLTGRDIGASVLLSAGTGTGQLDFTSGVVKSNLVQILGTALTETSGQLAAAFKQWFNVSAPVGTVNSIPNATAGAAGGLFIAGTNAATTVTTSLTTTFTGNLTGSVGSVTGAVGSVTGSVGSVTGAVGSVTGNVGGNVTGSVGSVVATVAANMTQILGTALTETSGQLAAAFKKFFNIASPTSTMNEITLVDTVTTYTGNTVQTGDAYARLGAPAGASIAADLAEIEAETDGISAIPTTDNTSAITAIKAQTDQLAFTSSRVNANVAGQVAVKKNTALAGFTFPMTDSTLHTPKTGLTVTLQRSIDGGALANATNSVSELSGGLYIINLSAADLNGSTITFYATAAAADTQIWTVETT